MLNTLQIVLLLFALVLLVNAYARTFWHNLYEGISARDGRLVNVTHWRRMRWGTWTSTIALVVIVIVLTFTVAG